MAHPLKNPEPWLYESYKDGKRQLYAHDPKAHVRFRVSRIMDLHYPHIKIGWGFMANGKPKPRPAPHAFQAMQDKLTRAYRELVNQAITPTKDDFMARYAGITPDDERLLADWPVNTIGTAEWREELGRRRNGCQPYAYRSRRSQRDRSVMRDYVPEETEFLEPFKPNKQDWLAE